MRDFPIGTLTLSEPARTAEWKRWRAELDFDALSYECLQTLPALAPWLPRWIEGDPYAQRFLGIVKMAWSRNQIHLQRSAELHDLLSRSSIEPVVLTGPLAWSLLSREEGSIRTIPDLTMLVRRQHLFSAGAALNSDGWELRSPQPDGSAFDWSSHLAFIKGEQTLHLHWRMFPPAAPDAVAFEAALFDRLRTIEWKGHKFQVLSHEADLLCRLYDRQPWDPVPWQADVLMMSLTDVDWVRLRRLVVRFSPFFEPVDVLGRLNQMRRDWELSIPPMRQVNRRTSPTLTTRLNSARSAFARFSNKLGRLRRLVWRA